MRAITYSRVESIRLQATPAQVRDEAIRARAISLTILYVVDHKSNGFQSFRNDAVPARIQAFDGENLRFLGYAVCFRCRYASHMSPVTT